MADEQVLERFVTEFKFRYDKSALSEIERRIERLESGLKRASAVFFKAGASLLGTQAGLFTAFSKSYEKNLAQLASKTGKTFDEIEKHYASDLKRISRDTGRTFGEVSDALQKSISAGVEGKKALDLVEQSARSAAAGIGIAAEQVSAATTLMEVFGTSARKSLDTITRAAQVGEGETADYAKGFKETAGLAKELGLSIDHIAAGLSTASNVAPSLMHASTWLRSFFESMLAPTEDARKRLAELNEAALASNPEGLKAQIRTFQQLRDIAKEKGLVTLLETFKELTGTDPELQKKLLGRVEALKFTTSVNVKTLDRNLKSIQESFAGSVDFAYQQQRSWLQFQKMMQAVKEFSFTVGRYVVPPLEKVTTAIHAAREAFSNLPEGVKVAIGRIIMAGPVLLGIGAVLWGLSKIIRPLSAAMMFFASKPLMMMTVGVAALAGSFVLLQKNSDKFTQTWRQFKGWWGGSGSSGGSSLAPPKDAPTLSGMEGDGSSSALVAGVGATIFGSRTRLASSMLGGRLRSARNLFGALFSIGRSAVQPAIDLGAKVMPYAAGAGAAYSAYEHGRHYLGDENRLRPTDVMWTPPPGSSYLAMLLPSKLRMGIARKIAGLFGRGVSNTGLTKKLIGTELLGDIFTTQNKKMLLAKMGVFVGAGTAFRVGMGKYTGAGTFHGLSPDREASLAGMRQAVDDVISPGHNRIGNDKVMQIMARRLYAEWQIHRKDYPQYEYTLEEWERLALPHIRGRYAELHESVAAGTYAPQSKRKFQFMYYRALLDPYIEGLKTQHVIWGRKIAAAFNSAMDAAGRLLEVPVSFAMRLMDKLQLALKYAGVKISGAMTQVLFGLFGVWFSYKMIRFTVGRAAKFTAGVWISTLSSIIANWRAIGGGVMGSGVKDLTGMAGLIANKKGLLIGGGLALTLLAALLPALVAGESAIKGFTTSVVAGVHLALGAVSAIGASIVWALDRIVRNFTGPNAEGYIGAIGAFFGRIVRAILRWTGTIAGSAVGAVGYIMAPLTDPARMLRFGMGLRTLLRSVVREVVRSIPDLLSSFLKIIGASIYALVASIVGSFMAIIGLFLPRVVGNTLADIFSGIGSALMLVVGPVQSVIRVVGEATRSIRDLMEPITGMFGGGPSQPGASGGASSTAWGAGALGALALAGGAGALTRYGKWGQAAGVARTGWGMAKVAGASWWDHIKRPGISLTNPLGDRELPGFARMAGRTVLSPLTWAAPGAIMAAGGLISAWMAKRGGANFSFSAWLAAQMQRRRKKGDGKWSNFAGKSMGMMGGVKGMVRDTAISSALYMLPFGEILSLIPTVWWLGKLAAKSKWGAAGLAKMGAMGGMAGMGAKLAGLGGAAAAAKAGAAGLLGKAAVPLAMMGPYGWGAAAALAGGYGLWRLMSGGKKAEGEAAEQLQVSQAGMGALGGLAIGGMMLPRTPFAAVGGIGLPGRTGGGRWRSALRLTRGRAGIAAAAMALLGAGYGGAVGARGARGIWESIEAPEGTLGAPGDLRVLSDAEAREKYRYLIPVFGKDRLPGFDKYPRYHGTSAYDKFIAKINEHDRRMKMRQARAFTSDAFGMRERKLGREGQGVAANRMRMQRMLGLEGLSPMEMDEYMAKETMWGRVKRGLGMAASRIGNRIKGSQIDAGISADNFAYDQKSHAEQLAMDRQRVAALQRAGNLKIDEATAWSASVESAMRLQRQAYWERMEARVVGLAQWMAAPLLAAYASVGGWWGKLTARFKGGPSPKMTPRERESAAAKEARRQVKLQRLRELGRLALSDPDTATWQAYEFDERIGIATLLRDAEAAEAMGDMATGGFFRSVAAERQSSLDRARATRVIPEADRAKAIARKNKALSHVQQSGISIMKQRLFGGGIADKLRSGTSQHPRAIESRRRLMLNSQSGAPAMPSSGIGPLGALGSQGTTNFNINVTAPGGNPDEIASAVRAEIDQSIRNTSRRLVSSYDSNVLS